ncbi:hypothetical protein DFQ11_102269 [Winogradskyella epiphytica]|uniref:DUF4258 domain-containing protein n=1 Tax=Winogradskyella epiphytica TaxID=262005 RepID=A0A2V4XF62_9FLAO|nr:hypothetical protein [Winogradskyella epiphytica]PYE81695.1 hypothetical protein DFQ11_102269 [Winogradskyella epiphytica]GGW63326.1 hypothetical protein GCM10008085_14000 [Winogradskyella epiphytica]
MKFIHRLGYYLGGFALGIIFLLFFLNGKDASCDYGPNARTVKNINSKPIEYSDKASEFITDHTLDSLTIKNLIKFGSVDFSKSKTKLDSCKVYHIDNIYKERDMELTIKNCDSIATLLEIKYKAV